MERNIIIENICTACRCGERRSEEYWAAELRNLRELRDAGALCLSLIHISRWNESCLSMPHSRAMFFRLSSIESSVDLSLIHIYIRNGF